MLSTQYVALGCAALGFQSAHSWTVNLPSTAPSSLSQAVSPQFPAFGFEPAASVGYLLDYATNSSVNVFSRNLVSEITKRTGGKAVFRIDSTPFDYAQYVPDQSEPALPIALVTNNPPNDDETIGPSFWHVLANFTEADFVIGLPLAGPATDQTLAFARAAIDVIGLDRIVAFEVGNEPNFYGTVKAKNGTSLKPPRWYGPPTNETYAADYANRTALVTSSLGLSPDVRIFQAFDLGWVGLPDVGDLSIQPCFADGIDRGDMIKIAARHYYQGSSTSAADLGPHLMNHSIGARELDFYAEDIPFLSSYDTSGTKSHGTKITTLSSGIPLVLSEVGSTLGGGAVYAEQSVLGSALWQLDFNLYAMAKGISMINWQQNIHTGHDMWLPFSSGNETAKVYSNYYGNLFAAAFIGDTGGTTQVGYLEVADAGGSQSVQVYGAWVGGELARLAIINFDVWDLANGTRPSEGVVLSGLPAGCGAVSVVQLNSPEGAHANATTMTFGGSQWTYESMGKEVELRNDTISLDVKGGAVTVSVEASSAVMVMLQ